MARDWNEWAMVPTSTCTWSEGHADTSSIELTGKVCDEPAVRAVEVICRCCDRSWTVLECRQHAENTERLAEGRGAVPNLCGTCIREGRERPLTVTS